MSRDPPRQMKGPESGPGLGIWTPKIHHPLKAAGKGGIKMAAQVAGEKCGTVVALDTAQNMADLDVGVTVRGVLDLAALA